MEKNTDISILRILGFFSLEMLLLIENGGK